MSTGNLNLDLLVKLLGQTTNDNDHVALMASRKANEQLAKNGWTWETLLNGKVTVVADPFAERQGATFVKPSAPPPMSRPAPQPAPQPAPAYQPPPRTKPQPQAAAPAPGPNTGFAARRKNQFDTKCAHCLRQVPAGAGYLDGRNRSGSARVICGDNFGHNAPYANRTARPKADADDLSSLL